MTTTDGLIGQSNIENYTAVGAIGGAVNNTIWNGVSYVAPTTNGSVSFGNTMAVGTGQPCQQINSAISATALLSIADTGAGFWLDTDALEPYDVFKSDVMAAEGSLSIHSLTFGQGERDARSGLVSREDYRDGLLTLIDRIRTDFTNLSGLPNLPIVITGLGRDTVGTNDNAWQGIREAQYDVQALRSNVLVSATTLDLTPDTEVHFTAAGYTIHGFRQATAILKMLGLVTQYQGPRLSGFLGSNTNGTLIIEHQGGNDFTPSSAMTGIEVTGNGFATVAAPSTTTKQSATNIALAYSVTGNNEGLRYLHGVNPPLSNIEDNNNFPLEWGSVGGEDMAVLVDDFTGSSTGTAITAHTANSGEGYVETGFASWSTGEIGAGATVVQSDASLGGNLADVSLTTNTVVLTWTMNVLVDTSSAGAGVFIRWTAGTSQDGYMLFNDSSNNEMELQRRRPGPSIDSLGNFAFTNNVGNAYDLELTVADNGVDVDFTLKGAVSGQPLALLSTITDNTFQKQDLTPFGFLVSTGANANLSNFSATYTTFTDGGGSTPSAIIGSFIN